MPRIIVKERGSETRSLPVSSGKISVGRSKKNTIVLGNRYASGHHCEVSCEGGEWTVFDLNSTNGVFVNGAKVHSKKLEDGDKILVGAALLIYIADEEAIKLESLIEQLQKGSPGERELAASLLGQFGTTAVAGPLVKALQEDPESRVKAAVAEALGLVGDSKAVRALLAHFDTSDKLLRNSVVRSIIRIAGNKAVEGVAGFLKHESARVRVMAAYTLGQTQNARATKHLIKALGDEAFAVREAAVKSLGDIANPKALDALMQAANAPHRFSQVWVIESLGKIRSAEAVPIIRKALEHSGAEVREAAADALGKLRAKEAVPALIAALNDADPGVRKVVAGALEKLRKHIETERKLSGSSGRDKRTTHISSIGQDEEGEPSGAPLFGEDPSMWQKWWSEHSAP
jgi:HEAT repeat protein